MSGPCDIRILVAERDIYARQAIVSYLSWDRNTRVVDQVGTTQKLFTALGISPHQGYFDAVLLDAGFAGGLVALQDLITAIRQHSPGIRVICLVHEADREAVLAAYDAGASAYLVRDQVGIGIASAVRYALRHDFVVTRDILPLVSDSLAGGRLHVEVLPKRRNYSRLTQRIEQALWLCVVEGLPAELAAEEMGVSVSTVRSYIKEGYRILEAADDTDYPATMSPVERAFRRYSALDVPKTALDTRTLWEPAA
jgi:DNA-binding NarL/FixJ family response regulator